MVHFHNTFVFQSLLKDEASLKIQLRSRTCPYNSFSFIISRFLFLLINFLINLHLEFLITYLKILLFFLLFSFSIVLLNPFNKTLESSRACTTFIMSLISSLEIINVVVPEPCIFFFFFFFLNSCIYC